MKNTCVICGTDCHIEYVGKKHYEELEETIKEAKRKRGQFREIIEAVLKPTNFIHIETAREYIVEALEAYGLKEKDE